MNDFEGIEDDRKASQTARAYVSVLVWTCAVFTVAVTLGLFGAIVYYGGALFSTVALYVFDEPGVARQVMSLAGYVVLALMVLVRLPRMLRDLYAQVQRYLAAIPDGPTEICSQDPDTIH